MIGVPSDLSEFVAVVRQHRLEERIAMCLEAEQDDMRGHHDMLRFLIETDGKLPVTKAIAAAGRARGDSTP